MKNFESPEVGIVQLSGIDSLSGSNPREDELPIIPIINDQLPLSRLD